MRKSLVVAITGMILVLISGRSDRNGTGAAEPWKGPLWAEPTIAAHIRGLKQLSDSEKYVYGLANTLQVLVSYYVWSEGQIPTREEFLASPYNLLLPGAWTNPFTGKVISWSDTPSEGNLAYRMPGDQGGYLLIVPWIRRFEGLAFELDRVAARQAQGLGIFGVYPGPMVLWPNPKDAEGIRRYCTEQYSPLTHYCWTRKKEFEPEGFRAADWTAYVLSKAIGLIMNRAYQVGGEGMPRTLAEMRERYWWLYNTEFKNPFSGAPVRETPFLKPSAGDITLGFNIWKNDLLVVVMGYGEKGQRLPPYHNERESGAAWSNLAMLDYVQGLEGRSLCAVWKESNPVGHSRRSYELDCADRDHIFATSVPRYAEGELAYLPDGSG